MAPKSQAVQPDFVFLSYTPHQNRKSQAIQDTQRRVHAARKSHALARQRRLDPSSSDEASSSTSPESPKNNPSETTGSHDASSDQPTDLSKEVQTIRLDDDHGDSQTVARTDQMQVWLPPKHGTPATTLLGQGNVDPFDVFAEKGLPSYVFQVLDIGKSMN